MPLDVAVVDIVTARLPISSPLAGISLAGVKDSRWLFWTYVMLGLELRREDRLELDKIVSSSTDSSVAAGVKKQATYKHLIILKNLNKIESKHTFTVSIIIYIYCNNNNVVQMLNESPPTCYQCIIPN